MQKKKNKYLFYSFFILFLIYNICLFMLVNKHSISFWISYTFTCLAFLVQLIIPIILSIHANKKSDCFLGLSLLVVSDSYFIIQLVLSSVLIIISVNTKVAFILQSIVFSIYLIIFIGALASKEEIEEHESNIKQETNKIYELTLKAEILYTSEVDHEKKVELKKILDSIRYSDPVSNNSEIYIIDEKISIAYDLINNNIKEIEVKDLKMQAQKLMNLISERNAICKISK